VLKVHRGPQGTFANVRRGSLVIDMSTVDPKTSLELAKLGPEREVGVLDVTISGSTPVAEQGALVLFGGGDQGAFAAAESIFRAVARSYFYMGPSGSGAIMKLVVNSLLGIEMQSKHSEMSRSRPIGTATSQTALALKRFPRNGWNGVRPRLN
jgi:3-hydroxyisobutyrate dehydrogenase-like beta-hydroxyacid dehydrogenase